MLLYRNKNVWKYIFYLIAFFTKMSLNVMYVYSEIVQIKPILT